MATYLLKRESSTLENINDELTAPGLNLCAWCHHGAASSYYSAPWYSHSPYTSRACMHMFQQGAQSHC